MSHLYLNLCWIQPTEDDGGSFRIIQSEPQPTPSPPHSNADQYETQPDPSPRPSPTIPDSIPEGSGGNHRGQSSSDRSLSGNEDGLTLQSVYDLCVSLCKQVTDQAKEIKHLKAQIKKLKKKAKPVITHHKAWMKSVSMKQDWPGKNIPLTDRSGCKRSLYPNRGGNLPKLNLQEGQSLWWHEEKESTQKGVSTEVEVSTVKPDEGTDKSKVSTDKPEVSTAKPKESRRKTIEEFCGIYSQNKAKQKGVEIKDAEDSDRPRATSTRSVLTLKPLPKIDPKDKGKKLAKDKKIARKVARSDWEAEEWSKKKLANEKATKALSTRIDDIQARIEADRLLAARLQEEERETFTVEERAKFLYDTIAAQRRFLAQQRAAAIRSRPPTRTQLRNK
ncbi:hypothetical protein Tco_0184077 [Tanacetum coccineum]